MYAKIEDGEIKRVEELPTVGILPDGRHISGLNLLDEETLAEFGWIPVNDPGTPEYDPETHHARSEDWVLSSDGASVTRSWVVEPIPAKEIAEREAITARQQDASTAFDRIVEMPNVRNKLKAVASGSDTLTAAQMQRLVTACALVLLRERDDV